MSAVFWILFALPSGNSLLQAALFDTREQCEAVRAEVLASYTDGHLVCKQTRVIRGM